MAQEQISKEFAIELLNSIDRKKFYIDQVATLSMWKQLGYIKQNREEEIREEIDNVYKEGKPFCNIEKAIHLINLYSMLVEILDNKDKQC